MPIRADTHIQNRAPGPPAVSAVATPAILPVPTVAASAVQTDWNWLIPFPFPVPSSFLDASPDISRPAVRLHQNKNPLIWKK